MADTHVLNQHKRDAGDESPPEDEESGLQDTPSNEKDGCGALKSRRIIQWIPYIFVCTCLVLAVWALAVYPLMCSNYAQQSGSHSSYVRTSDNFKERTHIYYTDEKYLKALPDNLDEYCKPRKYNGSGVYVKLWQCPGTQLYIPQRCLCDYNTTCPDINGAQADHYRKRTCKNCTEKDNCPCQNSSKCKRCTAHNKYTYVRCDCIQGTNGTYCTKITKRHCTLCKRTNGLENCKNSNNRECFIQLNTTNTYICNWTETMGNNYPKCGQTIPVKEGLSESEAPGSVRQHSDPQQKTSYNLLWAIFVLLLIAVMWWSCEKFRTITNRCRKNRT
ncbi:uncharacterized protein [Mytilus edulis]|uniref:uncharacterized protein n=1 Tax=Mytilus edulis TaxID=6550 RepID=UPI0039EDFBF5